MWQQIEAARLSSMEDIVTVTPDPASKANNDLRSLGEVITGSNCSVTHFVYAAPLTLN